MLVAAGTNIDSVKSNLLVRWVERMSLLATYQTSILGLNSTNIANQCHDIDTP